jgi:hypothetical protein
MTDRGMIAVHNPRGELRMATEIIVQGGSIELHESESYNKARHRLNRAKKLIIDYENGNIDGNSDGQKFEPFHILSFRTAEDGRVSIDPAKVMGVTSDEPKDVVGADED